MDVWPVGLSTGCFYQQSILTCLNAIKQGGFDLIEVCSVPSHLIIERARRIKRFLQDVFRKT